MRAVRRRAARRAHGILLELGAASLSACLVTGCPLSDGYFIDGNLGRAGSSSVTGGSAGASASAGLGTGGSTTGGTGTSATGGSSEAASGGSGGSAAGGTGGDVTSGTGGAPASGGTGGSDGSAATSGEPGLGEGGERGCVPSREVCDGIDDDCNGETDEGGVCPTGCSARTYGGHSYLVCVYGSNADYVVYADASTFCQGARDKLHLPFALDLAYVESADENDFLKNWLTEAAPKDGQIWFGANDIMTEGRWVWGQMPGAMPFFQQNPMMAGGMPVMGKFSDFAAGEPSGTDRLDEDCGAMDGSYDWQWNDLPCSSDPIAGFICEQLD